MEKLSYRVPEAIAATGLKQTTLYELMKGGELPFVKVGTARLIMRQDLEALLRRNRVGTEIVPA